MSDDTKKKNDHNVLSGQEARKVITTGVNLLCDAVKGTLGPCGKNVILKNILGSSEVTKDGVSVALHVNSSDYFVDSVVQLIRQASKKVAEEAGDGTTTTTVLSQAIYLEGVKLVEASANAFALNRGMKMACTLLTEALKASSVPVDNMEQIKRIGTIAANGEELIGEILAEAVEKVGKEGIILHAPSKTNRTFLDLVEGIQVPQGYVNLFFCTDFNKRIATLENPYILVMEDAIHTWPALIPIVSEVAGTNRPLLILARDITGEALAGLVTNQKEGSLKVCPVQSPYEGDRQKDMLLDVCAFTGATYLAPDEGQMVTQATLEHLGQAERVIVTHNNTTIIKGAGSSEAKDERVNDIKLLLEDATGANLEFLNKRLGGLTHGAAYIRVGGNSPAEVQERTARVDDAVHATRAALLEGVVRGGGFELSALGDALNVPCDGLSSDELAGFHIVKNVCRKPVEQILENGGERPDKILSQITQHPGCDGFDSRTGLYCNLNEAGILDPAKVVRVVLETAISVAGTLLTTDTIVALNPADLQLPGYNQRRQG